MTANSFPADLEQRIAAITPDLIDWRRDLHANPELGNREFRTAGIVAAHLRSLGFDSVREKVAHTGVVGVLKGGKPGKVVALRADMDGLPVAERADVPFASTVKAEWNGEQVGVMHACGHDAHVAILMATASVLAGLREQIAGTLVFIFQPAEEMPPEGEEGGAQLMIAEGALADPAPDAIFGLHVTSQLNTGVIGYKPGPTMASSDTFKIGVLGRQTHGAYPWRGVDPIVVSAQVVLGLQTIVSRQVDLAREAAVVTVGQIRGGLRQNIIPDRVDMIGTVRTFDEAMRDDIHARIRRTAESIAAASSAGCEVCISKHYAVTINDAELTEQMRPTLERVAGPGKAMVVPKATGSEDFSFFQQKVPGLFFFVGVTPEGQDAATAATNHSPLFYIDEAGLPLGVRAFTQLVFDYLASADAG